MWVDCHCPPHCKNESNVVFYYDARWPKRWHALPEEFQNKRKVDRIRLRASNTAVGPFDSLRVKVQGENVGSSEPIS
jgi:hypothetical protein